MKGFQIMPPHPMFSDENAEFRPAEAQARDRKELLREVAVTMRHARTFITSREKMHPTGIDLYDQLLAEIWIEVGDE